MIPEYDTYIFAAIAKAACNKTGHYDTNSTALSKSNAYEKFLAGMEVLGNANAPDAGRVCLCSYGFANLLKQDSAFMRYGDTSQAMITKGVIGEVDGCKIVKVPSSRLPSGCNFMITHPLACCAPKQLSEYKIHSDPPGMSGWLCEGRIVYDAFILDNKADALYYNGTAITGTTAATGASGPTGG